MNTRLTPSAIGTVLLLLTSILLSPLNAHAGGRRRVSAVSPLSQPSLDLVVVSGIVDAGTIVWRGDSGRSSIATRIVTMRIGETSSDSRGTATIRAFVETFDPRCTIRINGVALTTAPRVIRRHAPIGATFNERIEIEVPLTAADGPLHTSIGWEVVTE